MHRVRRSVRENRLSGSTSISERSYLPYIAANSAWVAVQDARVRGFAAIDVPAASVWALFVEPEAEGLGVGRALHSKLLEAAREQGLPRLFLGTQEGSRAARFYEKEGWTRTGVTAAGELRFEKVLCA